MVEQVRVNPTEVRGYGNICEGHTLEDFIVSNSGLAKEKETVHGALTDVYKLVYSLYGLMFDFDKGNKQLYLQMGEADILSFGFDDDSKQLYLLDMARTGLSLGFDTDTNELYISDAPPIVHNYTLALDSESYTTSGSLSVSATLLDDGVAVSGATVSFTGGVSTVTATTNDSGVATATVTFNSSGTLTATYSNVSDTATVTVQTYLFYDDCSSSSGLSNYGTAILLEGGSAPTLLHDSAENAYKITTPDTKSKCIPINVLTDVDNFKFEADIKPVSRFGLGFSVSGGTGNGCVIGFSADSDYLYGWKYTNGSFGTLYSDISGLVDTGYLHITVTVEGTSLDVSITDNNNTTKTKTATLPSYSTRYIGIGLGSGTSNHYGYIKNIKVETL